MSKKIWTTEETCRLIEMYREENNLWNPKNPDYKNRIKKYDSLKQLGNVFTVTAPEIERKLKNILSQYRRERRNYKKFKKSGAAWNFHAKWFGYNLMSFLHDKNKARKGLQTVQETEVSDSSLSSDENEATQESLTETQDELTQNVEQADAEVEELADQGSEPVATEENRSPDVALHKQQEQNTDVTPIKNKNSVVNTKNQKKPQNEPQMEMVNLMKTICTQRAQRHEVDEYDLYGELVARKLKKLRTNYARSTVQNMFNTILYEAEIGNYDTPSTRFSQNLPYNSYMQYSGSGNSSTSYSNPPSVSTFSYSNPPSVAANAADHSEITDSGAFGVN